MAQVNEALLELFRAHGIEAEPLEALDAETLAALERAGAQSVRGEGRPWADVEAELRARFEKP